MPARRRPNPPESLKRYQAKRDFSKTPEPPPAVPAKPAKKSAKKLIFCVQKHLASHLHYDFRLEFNGVLLSWAVPKGPSLNPKDKRLAMRVEDHPFDYRTFEGVIPSGYGAGVVMLWDEGTWQPAPGFENIAEALHKGELKFELTGKKLNGGFVLVRTGGSTANGERERWLLIKHRDASATDTDIAVDQPRGVKSKLDFEGILRKNPKVWESHEPAAHDELQKIVEKVVALQEETSASRGATPRTSPRKRARKT